MADRCSSVGGSCILRCASILQHVQHYCCGNNSGNLTLSLLRVINIKIPLQPHKKYDITQ